MKFVVSISTVGIISTSVLWPLHSVQETSPNFMRRSWQHNRQRWHHSVAGSQSQ